MRRASVHAIRLFAAVVSISLLTSAGVFGAKQQSSKSHPAANKPKELRVLFLHAAVPAKSKSAVPPQGSYLKQVGSKYFFLGKRQFVMMPLESAELKGKTVHITIPDSHVTRFRKFTEENKNRTIVLELNNNFVASWLVKPQKHGTITIPASSLTKQQLKVLLG